MNKFLVFGILFISASVFSQTEQPFDTLTNPTEIITETTEYIATDLEKDTLNSAFVPLNNEKIHQRHFNPDFKDNYSGSEFQYDVKKESGFLARLREWWRDFLDWFKTDTNGTSYVLDEIINIILVFLLIIALGFLVYYLNKKGFIRLFSKKDENVISEKFIEENIDRIDFQELVQKAKQENNLRKAIRYYYLWLLKNWSQNQLIQYESNKTTKQYLNEIVVDANKTTFQYVSYIYDNVWYGYHDIAEDDFFKIEEHFIQLITKK